MNERSSRRFSIGRSGARRPKSLRPIAQRREKTGGVGVNDTVRPDGILKLLASYFYFDTASMTQLVEAFRPFPVEIMADSGGFSATTRGETIELQGYVHWLYRWKDVIHSYAVLDDLRSARISWDNQMEMERQGLSPLPIFHYGEEWAWLERYLERYPYIMLGGMAGLREHSWRETMPWFIQCFKRARGRAVFHGLGVSRKVILDSLPFYSADSTTYLNASRFGALALFDPARGAWETIRTDGRDIAAHHLSLLRSYGLSEQALRSELITLHHDHRARAAPGRGQSPLTTAVVSAAAASWCNYETYLRSRHGEIDIPTIEAPPGMRYYLVIERGAGFLSSSSPTLGIKALLAKQHALHDDWWMQA